MKNIFTAPVANEVINRINQLKPDTQHLWGKMTISQMLAHCCVTYEQVYENKYPKPNTFTKLMLKLFAKSYVIGIKPYKKNGPTGPDFVITGDRDFEVEKNRLINYIKKTQDLGENYFDGKESHSFGKLNKEEWNILFYKHLDHHLTQFGV